MESRVKRQWSRRAELFGCDLRSLGLFRIALALLLLADLAVRAFDLGAHYSDAGILPRAALGELGSHAWRLSLHSLSGAWEVQALLFVVAAVAAGALLVGFHTRLATIACFVLVTSVQNRNPIVFNGGDAMLRVLLFWGMFLPLGARFAIDARGTRRNEVVVGLGTVALTLQVVVIYLFAALLKTGSEWRTDGTAIFFALHLDQLVRPFGRLLLDLPDVLLRAASVGLWWFEALGALLLFVPWKNRYFRMAAVVGFVGFHFLLELSFRLGVFPWVGMAAWLPFVPAAVWDRFSRAPSATPVRLRESWPLRAALAVCLAFVLAWNVGTLHGVEPRSASRFGRLLGLRQNWALFAPAPAAYDTWYVFKGHLADGRTVDLFHYLMTSEVREGVTADKPPDYVAVFKTYRWRKFLSVLRYRRYSRCRPYLARYALRTWNAEQKEPLTSVEIDLVSEETTLQGELAPETAVFWREDS